MSAELTFGSWLRQRRNELGDSQDDFSERLGFSPAMLRKLESGERRPSGQIANLLADYFRIPDDEREAFVLFARTGRAGHASRVIENEALPGEVSSRAPWRGDYARHTNLPTALSALIGREGEIAAIHAQLLHPKVRLLTLTGPPGIGKTRLALEAASGLAEHFEDGLFFVDLAQLIDPDLFLPTVARSLDLKDVDTRPIEDVLFEHARGKRLLLVLDNFEQVLDAAPQVVRLMEACPWLKALATSREALHVRGERRFSVPPLAVPSTKYEVPSKGEALDTSYLVLGTIPSVELFMERAQARSSNFALTPENAADVAEVCVALEGLPLAIELAAARVAYLSPGEMRAALGSRLKVLTGGARDLPPRQRTLKSAIEWSYALLRGEEQALFRRLGVFVGGFTPEAAQVVCSQEDDSSIGQMLPSLADKSLIRDARRDGVGTQRFGMLEALREYACERLRECGEEEAGAIEESHALYFMRLAEEAEPHYTGAGQVAWLERVGKEHDNLRAALSWSVRNAQYGAPATLSTRGEFDPQHSALSIQHSIEASEIGLRIASSLWHFWYRQGYTNEGRSHLAAVLATAPPSDTLRPHKARALTSAGILADLQADFTSARLYHEGSLAIHTELGDKRGMAYSLKELGIVAQEQGDHPLARSLYEQNLGINRELGDMEAISVSLINLGVLAYSQDDFPSARALYEESLAIRRELGNRRLIAYALSNLGILAYMQSHYSRARSLLEESLAIWREFGSTTGIANELHLLGMVACEEGDYEMARSLHQESLQIRWKARSTTLVLNNLAGLGHVAAAAEDAHRGAILLGATAALWAQMNIVPEPAARLAYESGVASAHAQLGQEAFEQASAEGKAMSIEEAVQFALDLQ